MKLMPSFSNTTVDGTRNKMRIRWCLFHKDQVHSSRYVVAQGIEVESFIRLSTEQKLILYFFLKYMNRKTKCEMKQR